MAVAAKWCRLQKKWLVWLLVAAAWSCASAEIRKPKSREVGSVTCEVAPPWTATLVSGDGVVEEGEGRNPMQEGRGKVLLVVLTSASSQHSLEQAEKLEVLESYFHDNSMPDVKFMLVNSAHSREYLPNLLSKNLTMTIFQENAHEPVWTKLGGKKDYVFVYDRCGLLTYKIPFPLSIIHPGKQLIESSVISTYQDDICGYQKCNVSDTNEGVDLKANFDEVKENNTEDSDSYELRGNDEFEDSKNPIKDIREAPTTTKPILLNGLWSLYRTIMKHMPWASKDNKDERYINSVRKFLDKEKAEENTVVSELTEESQNDMCNITQKSICRAWSKKKLDHARICCNLHTYNRSAQYLQKHCIHYPEHRCKKVELAMKCCHNDADNGSNADEQANTRASVSSHPKS